MREPVDNCCQSKETLRESVKLVSEPVDRKSSIKKPYLYFASHIGINMRIWSKNRWHI
jgi:hypothetical protein